MKFFQILERFDSIIDHINKGIPITPEKFAKKLRICKSSLYSTIEYLNSFGVKIHYNRKNRVFAYRSDIKLKITYLIVTVEGGEIKIVLGNIKTTDITPDGWIRIYCLE